MAKAPSVAASNYAEPDFPAYVEKAKTPTATQQHFTDWVIEKTGQTFANKKEEAAFRHAFALSTSLRGIHQASPENQARLVEQRSASEQAKAERAEQAENTPAAPAKAAPAKAAKAAKATAPAVAPVETAPPAKRAPVKRGGGRRTAAVETGPAPF